MWILPGVRIRVRKRRRTRARHTKKEQHHYALHKEHAREVIHERLNHWNQFYNLTYGRVAVRNQKSRWGSCSTKGNLNFNYRIIFLPEPLIDYIIIHELCHLIEFNHSKAFWSNVARTISDYTERKNQLYKIRITQETAPLPKVLV